MYFVHSLKCHLPPQDIKLVLNSLNYESSEHFRNLTHSFNHKRNVDFINKKKGGDRVPYSEST